MPATHASHAALRTAMLADAAATAVMGVLLAAASGMLESLLGIPAGLLRWAGMVLVPFSLVLAYLARRAPISGGAVWAVIGVNLLWAADSFLLLASGWLEPTLLGVVFVAAQGAAVGAFAWLEYAGLRRASLPAMA